MIFTVSLTIENNFIEKDHNFNLTHKKKKNEN